MTSADDSQRHERERALQADFERGALEEVASAAIRLYGPEIYGLLCVVCAHPSDADEVFSQFCEDLWRGLPGFGWRSSLRTWCYRLAHHARARHYRAAHRKRERNLALSAVPSVELVARQVRTTTQLHLRSEVKDRVSELRAQLSADDQELLTLRIDRRLPWTEIAAITAPADTDEAGLRRHATTLRKRYERIKERLRKAAAAL